MKGGLQSLIVVCGFLLVSTSALADEESRQYCNELYPAESYEAKERMQYVEECYSQYVDEDVSESPDEFYDGTVEEFVDDVAPQEELPLEQEPPQEDFE